MSETVPFSSLDLLILLSNVMIHLKQSWRLVIDEQFWFQRFIELLHEIKRKRKWKMRFSVCYSARQAGAM